MNNIANLFFPLYEISLKKYFVHGIKALDFADFCKAAEIIKAGGHLTPEGLKRITELKARMNTNRIIDSEFDDIDNVDLYTPANPYSYQSTPQQSNFLSMVLENNVYLEMFSTINFNIDKLYAVYSEIYTNGYFTI